MSDVIESLAADKDTFLCYVLIVMCNVDVKIIVVLGLFIDWFSFLAGVILLSVPPFIGSKAF